MILRTNGPISDYYVQTLCLLYFPRAKFAQNEKPSPDVPQVEINAYFDENNKAVAQAKVFLEDRECQATEEMAISDEFTDDHTMKIVVGKALSNACHKLLGESVSPWGILTGVRPTKVASDLITQNGIMKTRRILRDQFLVNPQKASLVTSVASLEQKILKHINPQDVSIYISIPFCPSRCAYCSFVSYSSKQLFALLDNYLVELKKDITELSKIVSEKSLNVMSIYIGGGTPTTLNVQQLNDLLDHVNRSFDVSHVLEYSIEAGRPDTFTEEKIACIASHGVTRICVNPQTLSDDVLKAIGRRHTVEDFYHAFDIAYKSGIRDINVDLIAGLPEDDFSKFSQSIDKVIAMHPTNITVHSFSVKKAADCSKSKNDIFSLAGKDAAKCVEYSQLQTKLAGYKPYYMYRQKNTIGNLENVGFALEGHECLYNICMMEETQTILSAGAGSVTKLVKFDPTTKKAIHIQRIFNPKYPYEYLRDANINRMGDVAQNKASFHDRIIQSLEE